MMHGAAQANLSLDAYRKRRRMLALDHKKLLHERYNIINGMFLSFECIQCMDLIY